MGIDPSQDLVVQLLEKSADAADTSVLFLKVAVLIFCLQNMLGTLVPVS